jgi:putative tricarboxylic transport membrane protein
MPPTSAIIMLSCIYWGALFGGAITSILFNIPGEPFGCTTFDGYPLASRPRRRGLTASFTSSFVGARRRGDDHVPGATGRKIRAQVRATRILRGVSADVLQLHRHGQGISVQDAGRDDLGFALAAVGMDTVTGQLR